jgi:S1-C subfamily serine protease
LCLPDTPASTAGLAFEDVIVAIDDEPVTKIPQIQQYIANISPGTSIDIDVVRYGQPKRIRLKLGEQPDDMAGSRRGCPRDRCSEPGGANLAQRVG